MKTPWAYAQNSYFAPPLPMGNRTPFTLVYLAPTAPDYTLATGKHQWSSHIDISSHSLIEASEGTSAELDGETTRLALSWQFRPTERWIVRAELPLVAHGGGFLDGIIDGWHSLTRLPEGQRPQQPQDRLLFEINNNSQQVVLDSRRQSLGDANVSAAYQVLKNNSDRSLANWLHSSWVQLGIKLPTGSTEDLSGSGATDVAFSFHHYRQQNNAARPLALNFDAFLIHPSDSNLISLQENLHAQLQFRVSKKWTKKLIPEVQLRYRTATYQNSLDALGGSSFGIDVGLIWLRKNGYWRAGFSEDLDVDSAPDVGLFFQYTHRSR